MAEIGRLLPVAKGSSLLWIQSVDATEWRIGALHDLRATDYKEATRAYHVGPVLYSNVKAINAPGTITITVSLISKRF